MYTIRKRNTDSVTSVDKPKKLSMGLQHTSQKLRNCGNLKATVDQYEVFQDERNKCHTYRLILTINPYCSNMLFNPYTEIVKDEGSDHADFVPWEGNTLYPKIINNTAFDNNAYDFHPGYNIFNNHILRGTEFRVVIGEDNPALTRNANFNTLSDTMRTHSGTAIQVYKRKNGISSAPTKVTKHLYDYDSTLSFEDSINANLVEENGWFGFVNVSLLQTTTKNGELSQITKVINKRGACEFIDMYPDRTLFSFSPKYNNFRKRSEYNWDIILTYPYENDTTKEFLQYGVPFYAATLSNNPWGREIYQFRSALKHNLAAEDFITLTETIYITQKDDSGTFETKVYLKNEDAHRVGGLGDFHDGDVDYYFYIDYEEREINYLYRKTDNESAVSKTVSIDVPDVTNNATVIYAYGNNKIQQLKYSKEVGEEIDEKIYPIEDNKIIVDVSEAGNQPSYLKVELFTEDNDLIKTTEYVVFMQRGNKNNKCTVTPYAFKKLKGGVESQYYVRKFKKLPNFKYAPTPPTENDILSKEAFDSYLANLEDKDNVWKFEHEQYKLAFASTIYSDDITQITYTDDINLENIRDNLSRPLSEIYVTILKTHRGNTKWYRDEEYKSEKVEYSHCFTNLTSGVLYQQEEGDSKSKNELMEDIRNAKQEGHDITSVDMIFDGDIVEFSPTEYAETVIGEYNYRFNTWQRENLDIQNTDNYYSGIIYDDYDFESTFTVEQPDPDGDNNNNIKQLKREEGYYYKPHYRIPLRMFGELQQASHGDVMVKSISPVQRNNIQLQIVTKNRHGINANDILILFDYRTLGVHREVSKFICTETPSDHIIVIAPLNKDGEITWAGMEWVECNTDGTPTDKGKITVYWHNIISSVNSGDCCFRKKNNEIPDYAREAGDNVYLWRDVLNSGESFGEGGIEEYTFTNNAFYVTPIIDFYLRRQDPTGNYGLYAGQDGVGQWPNDIPGNVKKPSNYQYKDEGDYTC